MNREIEANHQQGKIFPTYMDDLLPNDHPARFIDEYVNQLDLDKYGIERPLSEQGAMFYSPNMLLKVWLYCMLENIRSVRKMEKACYDSVSLLWLTDQHYPDHNTIWRFWVHNKKAVKALFKDTVMIAHKLGLVGLVLHAVDGTKIMAQAGRHGGLHRKGLESYLTKLDKAIDEMSAEIDANAENNTEPEYVLPEQLSQKKALRQQIKDSLAYLDKINRDHMHPKDPDSRMMRMNDARTEFAYNSQIVVDQQSGMIIAADVTQDESDNNLLIPMIEQAKEIMGASAEETVADGGYFSGQQLHKANEQGYAVIVNMASGDGHYTVLQGYPKELFTYDQVKDVVICPQGKELTLECEARNKKDRFTYRVYRCRCSKTCPYRYLCSQDKKGRRIRINPYEDAIRLQHKKQQDLQVKMLLKKRKTIVEPVFGIIKHNNGFRRFCHKGLDNVQTEWLWICAAFNLKKIYQYWALN